METRESVVGPVCGRPTGTVTFLFSDIEGSTSRWEATPEAMARALARHDELMRAAMESAGGHVFKTIGDAFCVAFAKPAEAVAGALAAQRALAAQDFSMVGGVRVRMALHSGTTDERDGDYFGPTVNRVARLLAVGHGGQVLLSGATVELLHGAVPAQCGLRDMGTHRLKDLARPEHVFQLVAPDLPESFPPLRSLDTVPNNLPAQLGSWVGREAVIAQIEALLQQHRLVSLVGTGGVGKTRCALHVAANLLETWSDGVWLVELAPVADPALLPNTVAQVLSVQEQAGRTILDAVLSYLKRKRLLLILDNCEHLIHEAGTFATAVAREAAEVRILITSRERLHITGEAVYRVPSLEVPEPAHALTPAQALRFGAVQLFADRASLSNHHFGLTSENVRHVVEVCRRLDGIPLAIELAAARVNILSPQQLASKLNERFRVLTGGDRSALPRQQTMRALIDWSYDLLSNDERTLLRRLAVFAGSFTLETVTAVCASDTLDELAILELLGSLVDKSLVQVDGGSDPTRYQLLESIRDYAMERLSEAGESDEIARAHAHAFLGLAERLDAAWEQTPDSAWEACVDRELENLRAALLWALRPQGDPLAGQRLVGALPWFWHRHPTEGLRWVRAAQEFLGDETPAEVALALDLTEARCVSSLLQHKAALAAAERAVAHARSLGESYRSLEAAMFLGFELAFAGRADESETILQEALPHVRAIGAPKLASFLHNAWGVARCLAGDLPGARRHIEEAIALARSCGDDYAVIRKICNLAEVEFSSGNAACALDLAREASKASEEVGDFWHYNQTLSSIASYLIALSRYDEARSVAKEALIRLHGDRLTTHAAYALQHVAAALALGAAGDAAGRAGLQRAGRIVGFVNRQLETLEVRREPTEALEYERILDTLERLLGPQELSQLLDEGAAWSEERAIAEAIST